MNWMVFLFVLVAIKGHTQSRGTFIQQENRLIGTCEDDRFMGFEIHQDTKLIELNEKGLFQLMPADGFVIGGDSIRREAQYVVSERTGTPQLMVIVGRSWLPFDQLVFGPDNISFIFYRDPSFPFVSADLEIIKHARKLLYSDSAWHKNDDRDCEDDTIKSTYSLFCALQAACIAVDGYYNHRNAVMQKVRHLIVKRYPNRRWEHRLRDFNNMPETDFADISSLLGEIEQTIVTELN